MKITAITGMASVQDLGRYGQRKYGIGVNGAMDQWALKAGNALLNNDENTAAIEVTLGGISVEFEQNDVDATTGELAICVTGALYEMYLVDHATTPNPKRQRIANGWRVTVQAGQTLELKRAIQGMHAYICIQGGLQVQAVLGSASTNTKAEFGGYQGRFLAVGDHLTVANVARPSLSRLGIAPFVDNHANQAEGQPTHRLIRVIKNSEYENFTPDAIAHFTKQPYKLSSSSNRMGYRLEGAQPLTLTMPLQMNSHGVDVGMIQVPPQGQPIVLMADSQTTGGYPKIASVIQADIGEFAQLRFGQSCQFVWVALDQAIEAKQARERYINQIKAFAQGQ